LALGFLTENISISLRKFLTIMFLFSSSFAWFLSFYNRFDDIFTSFIPSQFWLNIGTLFFLFSVIISGLIGSFLVDKIGRKNLLFWSTVIGVLSSGSLLFINGSSFAFLAIILIGSSFGFIMPSVQSFLSESTIPEERGRVSGFIVLSIFLFSLVATIISNFLGDANSRGILSVTIGLKLTGFLPFLLGSVEKKPNESKPWSEILKHKDFEIYLLAYILFNVCSGLVSFIWHDRPLGPGFSTANESAILIRYVGIAIIAIVTGFLADKIGRKKPVILGIVLLGVAYAFVGIGSKLTPETYFLQMVISGFAWGILIVVYNVIPGDLAFLGSEEKFYTMGLLIPFVLYTAINGAGRFFIYNLKLDISSTILSIALFLSVIPILYAKETLSQTKIKEIKFRDYTKKVSKVVRETEEKD
jgi:MFS family permease